MEIEDAPVGEPAPPVAVDGIAFPSSLENRICEERRKYGMAPEGCPGGQIVLEMLGLDIRDVLATFEALNDPDDLAFSRSGGISEIAKSGFSKIENAPRVAIPLVTTKSVQASAVGASATEAAALAEPFFVGFQ